MNSTRALSNLVGFILLATGVLYLLVAFKINASLARWSLGGPLWVDLSLAGLFSASGLLFLVRDKRVKQMMNILASICFAGLIAWGVFGMGKV
jgi:uncharacterized membrane protein